jgi:hypothetical protein
MGAPPIRSAHAEIRDLQRDGHERGDDGRGVGVLRVHVSHCPCNHACGDAGSVIPPPPPIAAKHDRFRTR